ncbi:MAG: ATP-dependent zinc metalloprotease FtsH [Syntrophales bacterium]|jgi:cell division protease FtsH|nr:ATP-dependent zinc metalloprotease FtsH [Syntrophales bacterium]MDY0045612.1 ATP-dependent zinc metalloprotease FtsH [Syntrophales bacterium]
MKRTKGDNSREKEQENNTFSNVRMLLWVAVLWLILFSLFGNSKNPQRLEISYTEFKNSVKKGNITEITVEGQEVTGKFKEPVEGEPQSSFFGEKRTPQFSQFETAIPSFQDPKLMPLLEEKEVIVNAKEDGNSLLWSIAIGVIPWILIVGFFFYTSRKLRERMGGGAGGPFGFGKSKAKLYSKLTSKITFRDVAGLDNAKKELQEIVDFLKNPSKFSRLGGELPRGILLVGPPGVGKTLMARAVAGEANVPFYSISGSEFIEMFVGVGASRVRDMFNNAKKDSPSIIFIDELDSIGRVRGTGVGGGHDEREQTLNQILAEMDGFASHENVIVLAATNRPDVLDQALIRPGRFDRRITLELPQKKARKEILGVHTRGVPLGDNVNLDNIAVRSVGFSGADLKNLVNEAALLAARNEKKKVEAEEFEQARDKIIMGIEREDVIKEEEKRAVAYHEAGHAIVAQFYPGADPLEKVSIIPRGRALGATEQLPAEDRHNFSRSYLLGKVAVMLGGRAAEKIVFNDVTTGAGDDLKNATKLVRRMVCQWGMSEKVGPVAFRQGEQHPFLGREITEQRDFSEETARIIDEEVRKNIEKMENEAARILIEKRKKLDALVDGLLEHETLGRMEIEEILKRSESLLTAKAGG